MIYDQYGNIASSADSDLALTSLISGEALKCFQLNMGYDHEFIPTSRLYDQFGDRIRDYPEFGLAGMKIGETLTIRKPQRFTQ